MAAFFRNSNGRLSLIIDAFSRLCLQPSGSSIVTRHHSSQLRLITQSAARELNASSSSNPNGTSDNSNAPQVNRLPLKAYTYGTKMGLRTTAPKQKPSLQWTEEDDKELFQLAKEGKTGYEIYANNYFPNRSQGAIFKRLGNAKRLTRSLERQATEGVIVREGEGEDVKSAAAAAAAAAVGEGELPFRTGYYNVASAIGADRRERDKDDVSVFRSRVHAKGVQRKGKWTEVEDELLEQLVQEHIRIPEPALWSTVAGGRVGDSLLLRDAASCRRRWRVLFPPPSDRTGPWTDEEERLLQEAILEQFEGKYQVAIDVLVGKPVTTRHNLSAWRPALVQLSGQEGLPILKLGSRRLRMLSWLAVADKVKSRSEGYCRHHFYKVYHNAARGPWTKQERALMKEALEMYGKDYWKIAEHVGTRSPIQVAYLAKYMDETRKVGQALSNEE